MSSLGQRVGARVRALREARAWSQHELAHRATLSTPYVGQIERGIRDPSLSVLDKLARALNVGLARLVDPEPAELGSAPELAALIAAMPATQQRTLLRIAYALLDANDEPAMLAAAPPPPPYR